MKHEKAFIYTILGIFIFWVVLTETCTSQARLKSIKIQKELISNLSDSVTHYKDKYGNEHAVASKIITEKEYLQDDIKSLSNQLELKEKQIRSYSRIVNNAEAKIILDTSYQYRDSFIYLSLKNDTLFIQIKDTIQIVDYWKRTWFLGRKKYFVDVKNSNPMFKTTAIISREVKVKQPKLIIGPSFQYTPFVNRASFGFSILYYPFSIKL